MKGIAFFLILDFDLMITFDELLDLLAVLNTNTSPWYKDFLPMAGAAFGVLLGLSLNTLKDRYIADKNKKLHIELIKDELTYAVDEANRLAKNVCRVLDEIRKKTHETEFIYVQTISNICFSEYYFKNMASYTSKERGLIHKAYYEIEKINSYSNYDFMDIDTGATGAAYSKNILQLNNIILAVQHLNDNYRKLYNLSPYGSVLSLLRGLEIQSEFYDSISRGE